MKTIYVIAGPNGSGKSTLLPMIIRTFGLDDVEYVCPDTYAALYFKEEKDPVVTYQKAMTYAAYKRNRLLAENQSMIMETVLSRSDKIEFLKQAKVTGYRIVSFFVGTSSPAINTERVAIRVSQGGHNVPSDKIKARYERSLANLPLLSAVTDELYVYDNSETMQLVYSRIDGETYCCENPPAWVAAAIEI